MDQTDRGEGGIEEGRGSSSWRKRSQSCARSEFSQSRKLRWGDEGGPGGLGAVVFFFSLGQVRPRKPKKVEMEMDKGSNNGKKRVARREIGRRRREEVSYYFYSTITISLPLLQSLLHR